MSKMNSAVNWRAIIGFELCWFLLVYFQQLMFWPVLAYWLYGMWRLASNRARVAVLLTALTGIAVDRVLVATGIMIFALLSWMPLWFVLLWLLFALVVIEVMSAFLTRPLLAFVLGAVGGPLSYWGGAALSGGVLQFPMGMLSYGVLIVVWGLLAIIFGYSRRAYVTQV